MIGHMIAVNVSPIDRGHVLLVPEPSSCLPQVSTSLEPILLGILCAYVCV